MSFLSIYLTTTTVVILLINSIFLILNRFTSRKKPYVSIIGYACALMFALSGVFLPPLFRSTLSVFKYGYTEVLSPFSGIALLIILSVTMLIILIHQPWSLAESALLVSFSTLGLVLMISTDHLIGFYLGVELYSLSAYILASGAGALVTDKKYHVAPSVSAGLKYFLLSALSSGVLVAGISLIYGCTGELTLPGISRMLSMVNGEEISYLKNNTYLLILGIGLVISTLAFKVGSAPFHFWVPDVYSKVSLFVNFYLISVPKIGILFTLIKFLTFFPITGNLILIFSILSLLTGAIGGLLQQKITRLLAYSSISHVGYILLALYGTVRGTPYSSFSPENFLVSEVNKGLLDSGIGNGISPLHIYCIALYLIIYSFMTIGVFSVLYTLRSVYTPLTKESYIFISSLKNLSKIAPFLSGSLAVIVLSMAGVPPLAGFVAKLSVYLSVLDNNGVVISVFAVLCSVVTAVYYLRIIKVSYFYNTETGVTFPAPVISEFSALVISFSTLILIFYPFLNPSILYLAFTGA
jgi:NADH-quinone oxidoreductase subunit N